MTDFGLALFTILLTVFGAAGTLDAWRIGRPRLSARFDAAAARRVRRRRAP